MKRLGTIAVIAGLLLATALFYRLRPEETPPETTEVKVTKPTPVPVKQEPTPTTHAAADGTLELEAGISHGYIASANAEDVYAAIDISAKEIEGGTRPPLNLAVVIDRSGSMRGSKLEYAKRAAMRLVDELEPHDRLSIISYASGVSVDISSRKATRAAKASMRAAVQQIYAGGGTNISGGYSRGFQEVQRWKTEESVNRVVLLSDGKATVGVTNPYSLESMARTNLQQGVSLTTMGVGLDYNEDLMAGMADQGAGNYYFIDQPNTVVSIFESEFDGLAKTVARNTSLVISLAEGVDVENLYGFSFERSDNQVMVALAEFQSGEKKNILLKLKTSAKSAGKLPVMDIDLSYEDVTDDGAKNQNVALSSVVTDDIAKTKTEINVDVISRVQQVEVAESLKEAMVAYDRGDKAQAQQVLEKRRSSLRRARKKYDLQEPAFAEAESELAETANDMDRYDSSSNSGKRMIKKKKARGRMILLDKTSF
ncbi:VWA domain-containing protein [Persicimonas caeni]|uniref:VWA domain-containing protein n=1 Tax=Persicimonas caeni TaxID=2292766 RepID=A0A4Y6Q1K0_PERCE|nr:VWA domain-containing protein [Persicimonas caeni]QDG54433.1 VWA domain-containing protein [Persicimonas caeni]QED35654.1 VWA domain-containing protein [Persicimonas caeni]